MAILKDDIKGKVSRIFSQNLEGEVRIRYFTQDFECEFCKETRMLLEELAALSNKINLEVYDFVSEANTAKALGVDKIPATIITGKDEYKVRYFGIPSGYEFTSLIEDIVDVSRGRSRLPPELVSKVKSISKPVHIQVFVTPTCPYCPKAVRTAHQLAIENLNIVADMVESVEFPHLANRYSVMAVPKTVINDKLEFVGALPEEQFIDFVVRA
ncbi:MAG: thioredoxin family protein [Nitrososphaerales archaeon]